MRADDGDDGQGPQDDVGLDRACRAGDGARAPPSGQVGRRHGGPAGRQVAEQLLEPQRHLDVGERVAAERHERVVGPRPRARPSSRASSAVTSSAVAPPVGSWRGTSGADAGARVASARWSTLPLASRGQVGQDDDLDAGGGEPGGVGGRATYASASTGRAPSTTPTTIRSPASATAATVPPSARVRSTRSRSMRSPQTLAIRLVRPTTSQSPSGRRRARSPVRSASTVRPAASSAGDSAYPIITLGPGKTSSPTPGSTPRDVGSTAASSKVVPGSGRPIDAGRREGEVGGQHAHPGGGLGGAVHHEEVEAPALAELGEAPARAPAPSGHRPG